MTGIEIDTWDEKYAAVCDYARRIAARLLDSGPTGVGQRSVRYILDQATSLVAKHVDGGRERPDGAASDALDALAEAWPGIHSGDIAEFQFNWLIWHNLMSDWPMGHYARMVADALSELDAAPQTVVELGAGVGATTRQLRPVLAGRGGRLVATDLLYRPPAAVDFDRPLVDQIPEADVIVATNALHCARDLEATLSWVRQVLKPGGTLIIAEGAPFPEPGVPWALNLLFGVCRGWYDRPGFREPEVWRHLLEAAGFATITRHRWPSRRYELGGTITAR